MPEKEELKDIASNLMSIHGRVRGGLVHSYFDYVLKKKGSEGVALVESKTKEVGYPMKMTEINRSEWYPVGTEVLLVLCIKEVFDWSERDVFDMGANIPKLSVIMKLFIRFLIGTKKVFQESPRHWVQNYDFGRINPVEIKDKDYLVIRVEDYDVHPISCIYNAGYIIGVARMAEGDNFEIKETKCVHKGDDFHEYLLRWKKPLDKHI